MKTGAGQWIFKRKFGCISLALSLVEIAVIWGVVLVVQLFSSGTPHLIVRTAEATWLLAGPASLALAVAGLIADSRRMIALFAFVAAPSAWWFCGLRMIV